MAVRRTRVNGNNASSSSPPSVEPAAPREKGPPNVRDILRRKEEEVKQMLAPEKDMSGEMTGRVEHSRFDGS